MRRGVCCGEVSAVELTVKERKVPPNERARLIAWPETDFTPRSFLL